MNGPEPEDRKLWEALDAFEGVEPDPKFPMRFWARVALEERSPQAAAPRTVIFSRRWWNRLALPALGLSCLVLAVTAVQQRNEAAARRDEEIANNLELYQNYEVIKSIPHLAAYDQTITETRPSAGANENDFDPFELIQ